MTQPRYSTVPCAHSGWYLQFSCKHSCRPVSRRGMRSASTLRRHVCILQAVTGWTTSSPRLSSFTSCCAPKEREIGSFNSSAFDVSSRTFSSLATTKWLYYCLPWQMMTYSLEHLSADTRRQLECSVGRPVRGADGNKDWERWTEGHHVIPGTSGGMDRLISHISIRIRCTRPFSQWAQIRIVHFRCTPLGTLV